MTAGLITWTKFINISKFLMALNTAVAKKVAENKCLLLWNLRLSNGFVNVCL